MPAEKANFDFIQKDNRLTRDEIKEVKELSQDQERLRVLLDTQDAFKDFINTEYKWANEWYLRQWWKSVRDLQRALWVTVDWDFWKNTFLAIVKFQKENWLVVDGLAWPNTQEKLFPRQKQAQTHDILSRYFREKRGVDNNEEFSYSPVEKYSNWFDRLFTSLPAEKIWDMTYCSRTARKNLYRLWVPSSNVPHWPSAIDSMKLYRTPRYDDISEIPSSANILDLFVDSTSPYEHRAVAYKKNWEWWLVLDPYFKWGDTRPIPAEEYLSSKTILWIYPHTSSKAA